MIVFTLGMLFPCTWAACVLCSEVVKLERLVRELDLHFPAVEVPAPAASLGKHRSQHPARGLGAADGHSGGTLFAVLTWHPF